ncbi:UNVERIFIED_CONTAM: hypothetical protein FKN15_034269 [Acipenser sinensis]
MPVNAGDAAGVAVLGNAVGEAVGMTRLQLLQEMIQAKWLALQRYYSLKKPFQCSCKYKDIKRIVKITNVTSHTDDETCS